MECTNDVCGMRRVGGQRRKGSEWWNEEVGGVVTYDTSARAKRVVVKQAVNVAKKNGGLAMGSAIGE